MAFTGCVLLCHPLAAQESATVDVPVEVKAGEDVKLTVKLTPAPSFDGGCVNVLLAGPKFSIGQCIPCASGQADCQGTVRLPADAPGGTYQIQINTFFTGSKYLPLQAHMAFEVIGNKNLIFPRAAEVRLNPTQAQLFRTAAIHVQAQIQIFKTSLAGPNSRRTVTDMIRHNIDQAVGSLEATQNSFRASGLSELQLEEQGVFFKDLRAAYEDVLSALDKGAPRTANNSVFLRVSAVEAGRLKGEIWSYPIEAQGALRAFEQNELAYRIVAETQSLVFDLNVNSVPAGAELCFYRRGDRCRQHADPTNTVIRSLPYALWIVRFEKQGYRSEEREHDPFREPNHVLNVELRK